MRYVYGWLVVYFLFYLTTFLPLLLFALRARSLLRLSRWFGWLVGLLRYFILVIWFDCYCWVIVCLALLCVAVGLFVCLFLCSLVCFGYLLRYAVITHTHVGYCRGWFTPYVRWFGWRFAFPFYTAFFYVGCTLRYVQFVGWLDS